MYKVLYKDTIENEILPHLSVAKRGFKTKSKLAEVINVILYTLKTGCQGIPIAMSSTKAGNQHDLHEITDSMNEIFQTMKDVEISLDGFLVNVDAGFDFKEFRTACYNRGVIANVCFNYRNEESKDNLFFDEELYKLRYSIERTNA